MSAATATPAHRSRRRRRPPRARAGGPRRVAAARLPDRDRAASGCSRCCTRSTRRCGRTPRPPSTATSRCRAALTSRQLQDGVDAGRPAALLPQHADHHRAGGAARRCSSPRSSRSRSPASAGGSTSSLLMLFTAGNLLPQQVIITPLYRLYLEIPLPEFMSDSEHALRLLLRDSSRSTSRSRSASASFVLSNYMKTIPIELTEAALVDGASRLAPVLADHHAAVPAAARRAGDARVHLDLQRLLLGARADADRRQAARSRRRWRTCRAQFFTDNNLSRPAVLVAALPTLIVYFVLQRQFIGGLTLGSTKG